MVGLVVKVVQNSTGKPVRGKYVSVGYLDRCSTVHRDVVFAERVLLSLLKQYFVGVSESFSQRFRLNLVIVCDREG